MSEVQPLTRETLTDFPLPRLEDGDKESKGRILVIAGSRQVPGAAMLAATCAMRAGAGKLRIATVKSMAAQIAITMPEAYVIGLPEEPSGGLAGEALAEVREQADHATAIVAGPGMEQSHICGEIATALLASKAQLALDAALLRSLSPSQPEAPVRAVPPVLLPHAGELASMLDCSEDAVTADPLQAGRRATQLYGAHVLVKGVASHVVAKDGRAFRYDGGAPGLGVSGSGDTLAGIIGGLMSRGADPLTALLWGVLLHGEAGEALSRKVGPIGFLAREIAGEIPALLAR